MGLFDKAVNSAVNKLLDSNEEYRAQYEKAYNEEMNRLAKRDNDEVAARQRADPSTLCVVASNPKLVSGTVEYPSGTRFNMDLRYACWVQDGAGNAYRAQLRLGDGVFNAALKYGEANMYRPDYLKLEYTAGKEVAGIPVELTQWLGLLAPMQLFDNGIAEFAALRGNLRNAYVKSVYKEKLIETNRQIESQDPKALNSLIELERFKTRPFGCTICTILDASYRMGAYDIQVKDCSGRIFRCAFEADDELQAKMMWTVGVNNGDHYRGNLESCVDLDDVADIKSWQNKRIPLFLYADGSADPCFTLDDAPNPDKLHEVKGVDAFQYMDQPFGQVREASQTVLKTVPELTRKDILGNDGFTDEDRTEEIQKNDRIVGSSLALVTGYNNRPYGNAVTNVIRLTLDDCNGNRYQTDLTVDAASHVEMSLWGNDRDFYRDITFDQMTNDMIPLERWMFGLLPAFLYTDGTADLTCLKKEQRAGAQLAPSCGYDADWAEIRLHYDSQEDEGAGAAQPPRTREEQLERWRDLWREDGSSLAIIAGIRVRDGEDGAQMLDLKLDDCEDNRYTMTVKVDLSDNSPFHDIPYAVLGNNPKLAAGYDDLDDAIAALAKPNSWILQVIPAYLYADGTANITPLFTINPNIELKTPSGYDTDWDTVRAEYDVATGSDGAPGDAGAGSDADADGNGADGVDALGAATE